MRTSSKTLSSAKDKPARIRYRCEEFACGTMLVDQLLPDGQILSLALCPSCTDCEIVDHVRLLHVPYDVSL